MYSKDPETFILIGHSEEPISLQAEHTNSEMQMMRKCPGDWLLCSRGAWPDCSRNVYVVHFLPCVHFLPYF